VWRAGSDVMFFTAALAAGKTVRDILEERCDAGDVQTCACICEVLKVAKGLRVAPADGLGGGARPFLDAVSTEQQRKEWAWWYVELLRQLELSMQANELCKDHDDDLIASMNLDTTSHYVSCARCKKPITVSEKENEAAWCTTPKCRGPLAASVSSCVLCRQPVKGMYTVCPGCGHGGHLGHMTSWFAKQDTCPSGCGHICNFSTFGLTAKSNLH